VTSGAYFTDIILPVRVTATTGTIRNDATVSNPSENPNNPNRAVDNTDPAVIVVTPPAPFDLSIKKYIDYQHDAQT
jgi:hypothetical protein